MDKVAISAFLYPEDILWRAKGGVLHGESPARIAFLRKLLEEHAPEGLDPVVKPGVSSRRYDRACKGESYYLYYFGVAQLGRFQFELPEDKNYQLEIIDPWNMTVTPVAGTHSGTFWLEMPSKPFHAVQARQS